MTTPEQKAKERARWHRRKARLKAAADWKARRRTIKRDSKYGLKPGEFDRILEQQAGACAICKCRIDKTMHIDHDHATGHVRGLLCPRCNLLLGHAKDDVGTLQAAIYYLTNPRQG